MEAILGKSDGRVRADPGSDRSSPFRRRPIRGLGVRSGFQMQVEDRAGVGLDELQQAVRSDRRSRQRRNRSWRRVNSSFRPGVPQLYVDIDRVKVKTLDVPLTRGVRHAADVPGLGLCERLQQVRPHLPGARAGRARVPRSSRDDIERLEVRNARGQMIPLGSVAEGRAIVRSADHSPLQPVPVGADPRRAGAGRQLGRGARAHGADRRGRSCRLDGLRLDRRCRSRRSGSAAQAIVVFALRRAAGVPGAGRAVRKLDHCRLAVILVVPLGLLGAIAAVSIRGMDNNIYTQIGIVLIIALASKNAILIVEFARDLRQGRAIDLRRRRRSGPAAVPADSDDLVRVHPGRGAAGVGDRRRAPRGSRRSARRCSAA